MSELALYRSWRSLSIQCQMHLLLPCRKVPYCARRIPHVVGSGGDPYCHVGRWVALDAAGGAAVHETHRADEVRWPMKRW